MKYISTRGKDVAGVTSAHAIRVGLAADGGLYMPEVLPTLDLDEIDAIGELDYPERAAVILSKFLEDYDYSELYEDAKNAYGERFFGPVAPISELSGGIRLLELWHGPTSAFKDMALQLMPRLFVRALKKCGEKREALILVATSGDTGKAALEGYRDIPGTKIEVFFPDGGVSDMQKLQMQTQAGSNVRVVGIKGNFDDAQNGVKRMFSNPELRAELDRSGAFLSSANSINWGRLVPQIVYYVSAYCDLVKRGDITRGELIDVCVPTGNFGNILAAFIAKKMGLPIGKLVCASNRNDVLCDFLSTGVYNRRREFYLTSSPSMDILISSNLERLLYLTLGAQRTAECMKQLAECGEYRLTAGELAKINEHFVGYRADDGETAATLRAVYEKENCLIDTHTAVALKAVYEYKSENKAERIMLAVSTASPYKFPRAVYHALTGVDIPEGKRALAALHDRTSVEIPKPLSELFGLPINHSTVIDNADMEKAVRDFAGI